MSSDPDSCEYFHGSYQCRDNITVHVVLSPQSPPSRHNQHRKKTAKQRSPNCVRTTTIWRRNHWVISRIRHYRDCLLARMKVRNCSTVRTHLCLAGFRGDSHTIAPKPTESANLLTGNSSSQRSKITILKIHKFPWVAFLPLWDISH